jgi:hypothetical protein
VANRPSAQTQAVIIPASAMQSTSEITPSQKAACGDIRCTIPAAAMHDV